jgi:SAM-dependent methyltransferase
MQIPYPPLNLKRSVGPTDDKYYDNQAGLAVFGDVISHENYKSVFDFGCGCGRVARQMMLQKEAVPETYVGIDLYIESIKWASENLSSFNDAYTFYHHDVYNAQLNPDSDKLLANFPVKGKYTLVNAHSVFTHICEPNLEHYLSECARILDDDGVFRSTWFLFDKELLPMMQESQNCLYINLNDPTNATIYDYKFLERMYDAIGMVIYKIIPPEVRGHQWTLLAKQKKSGCKNAEFPEDVAPIGIARPPISI